MVELWIKCSCGKETSYVKSTGKSVSIDLAPGYNGEDARVSFTCSCGRQISVIGRLSVEKKEEAA